MSDKNFDVVVYGASGFAGKLVVEYLHQRYGDDQNFSWALAGRSQEKLTSVRDELGISKDVTVLIVDSNDESSVIEMVTQTKCVLTTVGPYQLYGQNIIKQCAQHGTDYVDLCGEPGWMHEMINEYSKQAEETGARIVFSCGFDSIPFDLGVFFLQNELIAKHGKPASSIRGRVRAMNGEFSGGTAASLGATMASLKKKPELFEVLANPFALSNGFVGPEQPRDHKPVFDEKLETWVAPFFMAPINTKNVHRSNMLMDHMYGEDFCYNEMWIQGPGEEGKAAAEFVSKINPLADAPEPGEGPSRESRENGNYDVLFCADLDDGSEVHASVAGDLDPGYGSTSKMIAESAICLVKECSDLKGGIYTPAPSMGENLIARLEANAGLTFKIEKKCMNRVSEILGVKYPIIQAPMGWIARSQLAAAVSNAGGFGIIETSSGETENCKAEILAMAELTDKPFGVNLPLMFLRDESMIELVLEQGIKFVTTSAGDPGKYIHILKDAGIKVFHAVPSVAGAIKAVDAGVDGLVIEGTEGGGFKSPEEVGLIVLIQAIRKHTNLPIVAAGGIVDGVGMAAAFAAGAEGIQMGTRFVSSKESPVHDNFKNSILASNEQGTWILNKKSKPCIRALKTDFTSKIHESGIMEMTDMMRIQDLYFDGDMNAAPALTGQSAGLIDQVKSVSNIIEETILEFNETCKKMSLQQF